MTVLAIHQPNFFPWMPFFEKMRAADGFVLLTKCQWEKGNYQNRFNIEEKWYTMSVLQGLEPIADKKYRCHEIDWARIKARLPEYKGILACFDDCISESLVETNERIIRRIAKILGIKTVIYGDNLNGVSGTERLIDHCRTLGADTYLSGPSGPHYMNMGLWDKAGIKVQLHEAQDRRPILEVLREFV